MKELARNAAVGVVLLTLVLAPGAASAQNESGAIAGVVTDATGGVLPGVTVAAASPALIEGSRVGVSDGSGQYQIIALRPGTYSVTFTLPGFSTVVREGIELNAGFTANVNAELRVGSVEETITVTGASPVVDIQNVRTQAVLTRDLLDAAPISKNYHSLADLVVGVSGPGADVGGIRGETYAGLKIHGGSPGFTLANGMRTNTATNYVTNTRYQHNQLSVQEVVIETSAISAEQLSGGVNVNMVPKDGGNTFTATSLVEYASTSMQGKNFSDELKARGLPDVGELRKVHDIGFAVGGPIVRDTLWFYTAHRDWGGLETAPGIFRNKFQSSLYPGNINAAQGLRYEADLDQPALNDNFTKDNNLRLTWQAASNHKISLYGALQEFCMCPLSYQFAPEASYGYHFKPNNLFQATYTFPMSNRLLIEAGWTMRKEHHLVDKINGAGDAVSVVERTLGTYGSKWGSSTSSRNTYGDHGNQGQQSTRFALSYVTGSHAFKTGVTTFTGLNNIGGPNVNNNSNVQLVLRNGVPEAINLAAYPHHHVSKIRVDLGIYAQDQWTVDRLTLNLGVRFDYLNGYNPAQCRPAGDFTPEFCFDEEGNQPLWKDISPRVGAAYDLFGDGQTALKVSLGRYVTPSATQVANLTNPAAAIAAGTSRSWTDTNGDFLVDCDVVLSAANGECGPIANQLFGTVVQQTRLAEDVTEGWHTRNNNWQASVTLDHELRPGLGLTVGYFRTWWGNGGTDRSTGGGIRGWVTDNLAVTPADFDSFCVTAPTDSRLPGGGGFEVCDNLFNVSPDKFGQVDNLVSHTDNFGDRTYIYDGVDVSMNARFGAGGLLYGGVSLGRVDADQCATPDVPGQFCKFTKGLKAHTQVKFSGSYPLPWDMQVSGTFLSMPGIALSARWNAPNAAIAPSLGRNLSGGRRSVRVQLIEPWTQFEDRLTRVDVRLAKTIQVGRVRLQPRIDLYNVLNAATILRVNTNFGSRLHQPSRILAARFFKVGLDVRF